MEPGIEAEADLASDGFSTFYLGELEWARRLAYVFLNDAEAAEDIAQEAFLSLHKRFDSLENPRGYLRVTVVNACRRHKRRETRRRALHDLAPPTEPVSQEAQEILELIDKLPVRQRAVVILRYFDGLTEAEIASTLSCRPGTVKSLASRALARLRKELL